MTSYLIKRFNKYSRDELTDMLRKHSDENGLKFLSGQAFSTATGISEATIANHFGSWAQFCATAGLSPRYSRSPTTHDLFENLDAVWTALGRQPRAKELKQPLSPISISQYNKSFKQPWFDICVEFLAWRSGVDRAVILGQQDPREKSAKKSAEPRGISLSLRYAVLRRDGFRCVLCGRSPATEHGCELHIDHIEPWSTGGKTEPQNLRSTCSICNLGRGNKYRD